METIGRTQARRFRYVFPALASGWPGRSGSSFRGIFNGKPSGHVRSLFLPELVHVEHASFAAGRGIRFVPLKYFGQLHQLGIWVHFHEGRVGEGKFGLVVQLDKQLGANTCGAVRHGQL